MKPSEHFYFVANALKQQADRCDEMADELFRAADRMAEQEMRQVMPQREDPKVCTDHGGYVFPCPLCETAKRAQVTSTSTQPEKST